MKKPSQACIWFFDANQRVYAKGSGHMGGPIWREHWREVPLIGETSQSYVLDHKVWTGGRLIDRVSKADVASGRSAFVRTVAEIDRREWLHVHRVRLVRMVEQASYEQLREIALIVGYEVGR